MRRVLKPRRFKRDTRARVVVAVASTLVASTVVAPPVAAQAAACAHGIPVTLVARSASVAWEPPLDRLVTLDFAVGTLGDALDSLSRAADVRISYSPEVVAADRPVCVALTSVPLGDALREILRATEAADPDGTAKIHPAIADIDHVVLAPAPDPRVQAQLIPSAERVYPLEGIIVTGEPSNATGRGIAHATEVIDAERIAALGSRDLGAVLATVVPGFATWPSSATFGGAVTGSRGASSFTGGHPAIYLDGVRVADPLSLARLAPEAVERIEVIRGPAGAVLYGADAMDGVIYIHSRRGPGSGDLAGLQIRSSAGLASGGFAPGDDFSHDHAVMGRLGSPTRSAGFSLVGGTKREVVPDAISRYLAFTGNGQAISGSRLIAATARLAWEGARLGAASAEFVPGTGANPAVNPISRSSAFSGFASEGNRSAMSYTLGATAAFDPSNRWSHSLLLGVDGYFRSGLPSNAYGAYRLDPSGAAPATGGAGTRLTVRGTSNFGAITTEDLDADLSFVADYSRLVEVESDAARVGLGAHGNPPAGTASAFDLSHRYGSAGAAVYATAGYRDRLFLDAGIRFQANNGGGPGIDIRALPMLGASLKVERGPLTATARGAWGTGIRPANATFRNTLVPGGGRAEPAFLTPEETQTGLEVGVELAIADRVTLAVTRFDQRAISPIRTGLTMRRPVSPLEPELARWAALGTRWSLGEIANSGWEATSLITAGPLTVNAALATVDSHVDRLPRDYAGDLRDGDRMLFVPAVTAGLGATWTTPRGSLSLTASRAWNWVAYDRTPLSSYSESGLLTGEPNTRLRDSLRSYDGAPRLNASTSFAVRPGFSILLGVDNLLGDQRGEPDSLIVVPGRAFSVGLRANF